MWLIKKFFDCNGNICVGSVERSKLRYFSALIINLETGEERQVAGTDLITYELYGIVKNKVFIPTKMEQSGIGLVMPVRKRTFKKWTCDVLEWGSNDILSSGCDCLLVNNIPVYADRLSEDLFYVTDYITNGFTLLASVLRAFSFSSAPYKKYILGVQRKPLGVEIMDMQKFDILYTKACLIRR